jgi:hypothetical protein
MRLIAVLKRCATLKGVMEKRQPERAAFDFVATGH